MEFTPEYSIEIDEYVVLEDLPENASEYIVECMEGLKNEGKKVDFVEDFLMKDVPPTGQLHRYSFDVRA